jgi:hypothetical protein
MITRTLAAFGLAFFLAACANGLVGQTAQQRLYELDGAYKAVLELAVGYKEACFARPAAAQVKCRPVVERIREADIEFHTVREGFDTGGGSVTLAVVEAALARLKTYVFAKLTEDSLEGAGS